MKKYKCPDCGKEFNDGIIIEECPTCGCPADIIKKNEICPQCGKPLPLQNLKSCPECGCNLSAQPAKAYDVICPDCNSVITDENSDCPNCGCPPSEFKRHIKENEHHKPKTQKKSGASQALIIICILALIGGVGLYYKNKKEAEEKAQQEQYQKELQEQQEQQAQREREEMRKKQEEERLAEKAYNALRIKWKDFSGTTYRASQFTNKGYQYYAFSYNSLGKGRYIIWWNYPGTNVVEEKMEFSIYKVESDANYLYLYTNELNTPVKIKIEGRSLYTSNGEERYEVW